MKRILSLLLTAALAAALLACPAAAAGSAPWVQVNGQSVSLQGLPEQYHAVQITFELNQAADSSSFRFDASLSGENIHTTYTVNGDSLTL